ncbi:MAG: hypothetical protein NUV63_12205 [Gallionella sp.]|nr:hypothetical protein [Gallionella sp.]
MARRVGYWAERNAVRRQDPAYQAQQAEWNKAWLAKNGKTPERLARKAELMRAYRVKHIERHNARLAARRAIEAGTLVRKPCEVCGTHPAHGHHDDYSKPLAVRWLCPAHHREHHAKATQP